MQEKLALNVKVPRLGRNRLGVFFVRSSHTETDGKYKVTQLSLQTKDPSLAKLLGLKFCVHLAVGGTMADFRKFLSTYIVDFGNGRFEANGEDDHRRAMEAQQQALQLQEKKLEAQRLAIQLAQIEIQELDAGRLRLAQGSPIRQEVAKIISELLPDMFNSPASAPISDELQHAQISGLAVDPSSLTTPAIQVAQMPSRRPTAVPQKRLIPRQTLVAADPGLLLKDEMKRHLNEESSSSLQKQTISEKRAVFDDFLACFGDDIPLNSITRDEVTHRWRKEEYDRKNKKDLVRQAKFNAEGKGEKTTANKLSPGRIEKRRGYLLKFFKWAIDAEVYVHANPMSQKMYTKQQIKNSTVHYREFSREDIRTLFGKDYPIQMGGEPDWYWVPLIALYSGARLGEVCDLQVSTFEVVDQIAVFLICDGKNNASKRTVPIHSKLLQLGLWEYAQNLKKRGCAFLFPQEPDDYRSKSVGRKWGQWVSACGIADDNKTFHSFRSTAITDMHNANEGQAGHVAIKRSVGHSLPGSSGVHEQYVRGVLLSKLQSAIESVDHDGFDVTHLRLVDPTFNKFFDDHFARVSSPGFLARKKRQENHLNAKAARKASNKK